MLEEAEGPSAGRDFYDLLHRIGWKGVKGSAHVKTGTMAYVRGLAGYIDTNAGHRLAFAIFFNDAKKRAALDAAFDPRVVAIDARSRSWRNHAIGLERKLASGWATRFSGGVPVGVGTTSRRRASGGSDRRAKRMTLQVNLHRRQVRWVEPCQMPVIAGAITSR